MGDGELSLEVLPRLVGGSEAAPFPTGLIELLGSEHDGVGVVNNLPGRVRVVTGVSIILGVLNLLDKTFKRLGGIVGGLEAGVVGFEVHRCDPTVGAIQMVEDRNGRHVGVGGVFVLECADVDIRHGRKKELFQSIVDSVVVSEQAEGRSVLMNVGSDLRVGAVRKGWGHWSWIWWNDKWRVGSQSVIHRRRDSEPKVAKLAAAVFGVDGGGVGFQEGCDLVDCFVSWCADDGCDRRVGESSDDAVDGLS